MRLWLGVLLWLGLSAAMTVEREVRLEIRPRTSAIASIQGTANAECYISRGWRVPIVSPMGGRPMGGSGVLTTTLSTENCTWISRGPGVTVATSPNPRTTLTGISNGTVYVLAMYQGYVDSIPVTVSGGDIVDGCPTSGYLDQIDVSDVAGLTAAVAAATAGDQIRLAAGTYTLTADLDITASGTATDRITICGPRTANIRAKPIFPNGDYIRLMGFRRTSGLWGIYSEGGSYNVIDSLEIDSINQEAVHLAETSTHNEVANNYIHHTGLVSFGEGVYIGSGATGVDKADSNWIHHNVMDSLKQECIEAKEGTTGNIIEYNTLTNCGLALSVGSEAGIILRGDSSIVRFNTIDSTNRYSMYIYPDCGGDGTGACAGGTVTAGRGNIMEGNAMTGIYGGTYAGIFVRSTVNQATNKVYCEPSNVPPSGHNLLAGGLTCTSGGSPPP